MRGGARSQYLTRMLNKSISSCARRTYLQLPVSTLKYRLVPIKFWTPTSILRVLGPFSVNFKIVSNEFFHFCQIDGILYSFSSFSSTFKVFQFQPEVPGLNLTITSAFKYLANSSLFSEQPCEMEY